ncbi:hypothetical protein LWI29_017750 [Acer saccharum]|uniref:Uncharacterized protein n=1 Tax=Acer saccharum TaxID=4024 RepID=A0AA39T3G0_ACESA|nr:hypothetical protein LWI29_017750 [Acer saccharum]
MVNGLEDGEMRSSSDDVISGEYKASIGGDISKNLSREKESVQVTIDKFSTEMEEDEASPLRGSGLKSTGLTVSRRKEASGNRLQ